MVSRPTTSGQTLASSDTEIAYAFPTPPSPLVTASIPTTWSSPSLVTITGDPLYLG